YVYLFSVIAIFVLLIACTNFMNLSTARSGLRAKEVGLKKTVGAMRGEIIRQFFGESFLLVSVSALIALGLVYLLIPAFNSLSGKSLSLNLLRPEYLAGLAATILVTGLTAGFYPALVLSAFRPGKVLKGDFHSGRKGAAFRKILVVLQFSLSIMLLVSTVVIVRQFRYMRNAKLGFDKDNVVQVPVKENIGKDYETLKARLLQNPAVLAVTGQGYSFAETTNRSSGNFDWEGRNPGQGIDMIYCGVEYGFFEAMNMTILEGRAFSKDRSTDAREAFILNEQAVRKMGVKDPVGKWFSVSRNWKGTIIGVAKDVQFRSFHHKVEPCVFYITDLADATDMGLVLVKIDGNRTREALAHIRRVWSEFNAVSPFEFRFLDETYDRLYRDERRMSRVFTVFAGLAVFIACLGLFGLASFMAERRTKEIGIRKVLGASAGGVVVMISGQLTRWVLAANIIAWPVAYFAMNKLLQVYAYRASLSWPLFALPSLAAFILACLTVGFQCLRTARTNPADALRYE
ncbi:MAG: ABC transporter permease, partial [Candidatus Aminicenantes bacterium]|nr:ABC transporter permease [Candidatus Aminicenantes bacterium]